MTVQYIQEQAVSGVNPSASIILYIYSIYKHTNTLLPRAKSKLVNHLLQATATTQLLLKHPAHMDTCPSLQNIIRYHVMVMDLNHLDTIYNSDPEEVTHYGRLILGSERKSHRMNTSTCNLSCSSASPSIMPPHTPSSPSAFCSH